MQALDSARLRSAPRCGGLFPFYVCLERGNGGAKAGGIAPISRRAGWSGGGSVATHQARVAIAPGHRVRKAPSCRWMCRLLPIFCAERRLAPTLPTSSSRRSSTASSGCGSGHQVVCISVRTYVRTYVASGICIRNRKHQPTSFNKKHAILQHKH